MTSEFVASAPAWDQAPAADRPEVALWGRSNVGKSSLLNRLVGRKGLAKVSATPGKTRLLNYFAVVGGTSWYLVDLPGYGYAKRSKAERDTYDAMVWNYLTRRPTLHLLLLLIDIRLQPQASDGAVIEQLAEAGIPFALVFTKADKLSARQRAVALAAYERHLSQTWEELPPHYLTSAETGAGVAELVAWIESTMQAGD